MCNTSATRGSSRTAFALAVFMLLGGLAHFAFPLAYQRIVPRLVGHPGFWVRWSGFAEIACAGLLIDRRTRRAGALGAIGVLMAVFPANVKMALDGGIPGQPFPLGSPVVAWARLPLQVPMTHLGVAGGRRGRPRFGMTFFAQRRHSARSGLRARSRCVIGREGPIRA